MANDRITIYQVAESAGVSISTVSKALSNKNGVSSATRQKVWDTAQRLGFVPSLAARSLTGGKTGIIGLLVPYSPKQLFSDPHLIGNIHGIEQALNEQNTISCLPQRRGNTILPVPMSGYFERTISMV